MFWMYTQVCACVYGSMGKSNFTSFRFVAQALSFTDSHKYICLRVLHSKSGKYLRNFETAGGQYPCLLQQTDYLP